MSGPHVRQQSRHPAPPRLLRIAPRSRIGYLRPGAADFEVPAPPAAMSFRMPPCITNFGKPGTSIATREETAMKVEPIAYSVSGLNNKGALVYDEAAQAKRPLLLMAPNWLGINPVSTEVARTLLADRYVVFMADMYGEGNGPTGKENPMEFLAPLMKNAAETRKRIGAAFDTMVRETQKRGIGDTGRRA